MRYLSVLAILLVVVLLVGCKPVVQQQDTGETKDAADTNVQAAPEYSLELCVSEIREVQADARIAYKDLAMALLTQKDLQIEKASANETRLVEIEEELADVQEDIDEEDETIKSKRDQFEELKSMCKQYCKQKIIEPIVEEDEEAEREVVQQYESVEEEKQEVEQKRQENATQEDIDFEYQDVVEQREDLDEAVRDWVKNELTIDALEVICVAEE